MIPSRVGCALRFVVLCRCALRVARSPLVVTPCCVFPLLVQVARPPYTTGGISGWFSWFTGGASNQIVPFNDRPGTAASRNTDPLFLMGEDKDSSPRVRVRACPPSVPLYGHGSLCGGLGRASLAPVFTLFFLCVGGRPRSPV